MRTTNIAYLLFLGQAEDQLLLDIVSEKPLSKEWKTHVKSVEDACKALQIHHDQASFIIACKAEASSRGLLELDLPIRNDKKAVLVSAPVPVITQKPVTQKQAKPKPVLSPVPKSEAQKLVADRLASISNETLLRSIRVFLTVPATSGDVFIPGVKMKEWEDFCWDEALARGLDSELEVLDLKVSLENKFSNLDKELKKEEKEEDKSEQKEKKASKKVQPVEDLNNPEVWKELLEDLEDAPTDEDLAIMEEEVA